MTARNFGLLFVLFVVLAFNHFVLTPMGYNVIDILKGLI